MTDGTCQLYQHAKMSFLRQVISIEFDSNVISTYRIIPIVVTRLTFDLVYLDIENGQANKNDFVPLGISFHLLDLYICHADE